MADDKQRRKLEQEDLEAGLRAAFSGSAVPGDSKSVLARIEDRGQFAPRVVLRDVAAEDTPIVRPRSPDAREAANRYQVAGEIARGGVGVVLKGRDVDLGREVALKVLLDQHAESPELVERFVEEAQIGGQLQHPGIVPVYELGLQPDGRPYFAMKLVKGKTLAAMLAKRADPSRGGARFVAIFEKACQTMAYAHARGVIHRDLKPSNIMVGAFGEVQIVDWGFAKVLGQGGVEDERRSVREDPDVTVVATVRSESEGSTSIVGSVMGTPGYMPPEQARGDVDGMDERSDVFSLGAILCEILTGKAPYTGSVNERLVQAAQAKLGDAHDRLDACGADAALVDLAKRCLSPAPAVRPADAGEVAEAVGAHLHSIEERAQKAEVRAVRARGRAILSAGALLVVLLGVAFFVGRQVLDDRAVEEHLTSAEAALERGAPDEAVDAVARALERDPDSAAAHDMRSRVEAARVDLEKCADLDKARVALEEARQKQEAFQRLRARSDELGKQVRAEQVACFGGYAPRARRAALAALENRHVALGEACDGLLREAHRALERASRIESRWGQVGSETHAAWGEYLVGRWRDAVTGMSPYEADAITPWYAAAVEPHDSDGHFRRQLEGRGTLTISATPADAEVYLFRYESYETVRRDPPVVPRLVPVPTAGVGRCRDGAWSEDFHPGDRCLRITQVEPGSEAARAGLREGDLVVGIGGRPTQGLWTIHVDDGSIAARAGLRAPVLVESINGEPAEGLYEMTQLVLAAQMGERRTFTAGGKTLEATGSQIFGVRFGLAPSLFARETPSSGLELHCLQAGVPLKMSVPPGRRTGIACEETAYPLVLSEENRVRSSRDIEIHPGSYLLLVRRLGFGDQRYPFVVERGGTVTLAVKLQSEGATPPGFVHVPAGPFIFGGDPAIAANKAAVDTPGWEPRQKLELSGFYIARHELTLRDWLPFLNDPATRKKLESEGGDELIPEVGTTMGPRRLARRSEDSSGYIAVRVSAAWPVHGISYRAAKAYLAWRNEKARRDGEPWVYDWPTVQQWQKAARGVDGRLYPWGNRGDYSLSVSRLHKPWTWAGQPAGVEPCDESPYGLADVAGSLREIIRYGKGGEPGAIYMIGGSAGSSIDVALTFVSRARTLDTRSSRGYRLVARPRK